RCRLLEWIPSLSSCVVVRETSSSSRLIGTCEDAFFLAAAWLRELPWASLRPAREDQSVAGLSEEAIMFLDLGPCDTDAIWDDTELEIPLPAAPAAEISLQGSATAVLVLFAAKCVQRKFRA
ncbi:unnamed protein product, partial [Symbiodinium sp. KB8]